MSLANGDDLRCVEARLKLPGWIGCVLRALEAAVAEPDHVQSLLGPGQALQDHYIIVGDMPIQAQQVRVRKIDVELQVAALPITEALVRLGIELARAHQLKRAKIERFFEMEFIDPAL